MGVSSKVGLGPCVILGVGGPCPLGRETCAESSVAVFHGNTFFYVSLGRTQESVAA